MRGIAKASPASGGFFGDVMARQLSSGPATEPVTLAEAKIHLHYDATDQNDRIEALIKAARSSCEVETNRAMITQTWVLQLERFPSSVIDIPLPPLQSITSIAYVDSNGDSQTIDSDNYQLDTVSEPGRIAPASGCSWPSTNSDYLAAVTITFVAGWTEAANVPDEIKQAIYLFVGHWFDNLSEVNEVQTYEMPAASKMLLTHWKA